MARRQYWNTINFLFALRRCVRLRLRVDYSGIYLSDVYDEENGYARLRRARQLNNKSTPEACVPNIMIDPLSIQELRDSFDDLKKRVDQLGRFL